MIDHQNTFEVPVKYEFQVCSRSYWPTKYNIISSRNINFMLQAYSDMKCVTQNVVGLKLNSYLNALRFQ